MSKWPIHGEKRLYTGFPPLSQGREPKNRFKQQWFMFSGLHRKVGIVFTLSKTIISDFRTQSALTHTAVVTSPWRPWRGSSRAPGRQSAGRGSCPAGSPGPPGPGGGEGRVGVWISGAGLVGGRERGGLGGGDRPGKAAHLWWDPWTLPQLKLFASWKEGVWELDGGRMIAWWREGEIYMEGILEL